MCDGAGILIEDSEFCFLQPGGVEVERRFLQLGESSPRASMSSERSVLEREEVNVLHVLPFACTLKTALWTSSTTINSPISFTATEHGFSKCAVKVVTIRSGAAVTLRMQRLPWSAT